MEGDLRRADHSRASQPFHRYSRRRYGELSILQPGSGRLDRPIFGRPSAQTQRSLQSGCMLADPLFCACVRHLRCRSAAVVMPRSERLITVLLSSTTSKLRAARPVLNSVRLEIKCARTQDTRCLLHVWGLNPHRSTKRNLHWSHTYCIHCNRTEGLRQLISLL